MRILLTLFLFLGACAKAPIFNRSESSSGGMGQGSVAGALGDRDCHLSLKSENLCATIFWAQNPRLQIDNTFTLKFWDRVAGSPQGPYRLPRANFFVTLYMPEHGHGSAPVEIRPLAESGTFEVSRARFTMMGKTGLWEIIIGLGNDPDHPADSTVESVRFKP